MKSFLTLALLLILGISPGKATTVIPPTFEELVARADLIIQAQTVDVRSEWSGEGSDRHIVSYVTFAVEDTLKGQPVSTYTIRLLGGTVGDRTMKVSDAPSFTVGDRDIVFVENNGTQFIPIVGIMHGRFRISRDPAAGTDTITRNDGSPLSNLAELGPNRIHISADVHLPVDAFKEAIRAEVARTR